MRSVQSVSIGDVCTFLNGGTPTRSEEHYFQGDIPWITGADITAPSVTSARSFITEEAVAKSATNRVPAGTVLLVTRTSVGKVATAGVDLCFSQDITALKPDATRLHAPYLVEFLKTQEPHFSRQARGATIKGITRDVVSDVRIPLPSLAEQRRIAEVLDRADALRAKRRAALAQLDSLTQSIFLDMFGDPVANPKHWPDRTLGSLLVFQQYGPRFYNEAYSEDGTRIVRITDLDEAGTLRFSDMPRMTVSPEDQEKYTLHPGDLIFARTGATVGKVALIGPTDPPSIAGAYFITMRFEPSLIEPVYARTVLTSPSIRAIVVSRSRQAAQQNFSGPGLRELPMPTPPIPLQRTYADRITAIEKLKATHHTALTELDALFASLQHRAFSGEL